MQSAFGLLGGGYFRDGTNGPIRADVTLANPDFTGVSPPEPELKDESVLSLEGAVNILDLETQHGLLLPRDAGFETLAGFVLARLQRIPYLGEAFEYEGHRYTVEEMEGHRIARVKIEKVENSESKAESAKHAGD